MLIFKEITIKLQDVIVPLVVCLIIYVTVIRKKNVYHLRLFSEENHNSRRLIKYHKNMNIFSAKNDHIKKSVHFFVTLIERIIHYHPTTYIISPSPFSFLVKLS